MTPQSQTAAATDTGDIRQLYEQTPKEIVSTLPRYTFSGRIVVIQGEHEAAEALKCLRRQPIVGFDTETRPAFRRGIHHKVALVQLATDNICFLFRLNHIGFPKALSDFLADASILKVGLSLKDDNLMLTHRDAHYKPGGMIDLQQVAAEMGLKDMSLQKLYANVFGRFLSKKARLSNWEADILTDAQKVYAATDAVTCLQLYRELERLRQSGAYRIV